jgi:hypothetical protein
MGYVVIDNYYWKVVGILTLFFFLGDAEFSKLKKGGNIGVNSLR